MASDESRKPRMCQTKREREVGVGESDGELMEFVMNDAEACSGVVLVVKSRVVERERV